MLGLVPPQLVAMQRPDRQEHDVIGAHLAATQLIILQHGTGEKTHRRI